MLSSPPRRTHIQNRQDPGGIPARGGENFSHSARAPTTDQYPCMQLESLGQMDSRASVLFLSYRPARHPRLPLQKAKHGRMHPDGGMGIFCLLFRCMVISLQSHREGNEPVQFCVPLVHSLMRIKVTVRLILLAVAPAEGLKNPSLLHLLSCHQQGWVSQGWKNV